MFRVGIIISVNFAIRQGSTRTFGFWHYPVSFEKIEVLFYVILGDSQKITGQLTFQKIRFDGLCNLNLV